jgi:CBS domain-containing protein
MQISAIMTGRPTTVSPHASAADALRTMHARHVRHLPVVYDGRLLGEVSERDLLLAVGWLADDARAAPYEHDAAHRAAHRTTVAELMRGAPSTLAPDDTVVSAALLFQVQRIGCAPVVDAGGALVGIVSDRDLRAAAGAGIGPESAVTRIMTRDVVTIHPDEPLSRAAELMDDGRIGALPVVEDGALVGILTLTDVVDHCINTLREPEGHEAGPAP